MVMTASVNISKLSDRKDKNRDNSLWFNDEKLTFIINKVLISKLNFRKSDKSVYPINMRKSCLQD